MSEQRFYDKQPDVLPKTLPVGTRTRVGEVATDELRFTTDVYEQGYSGTWASGGRNPYAGTASAKAVDWTSVPITPPVKDRPIQAGDWLECVNATCRDEALTVGERYQVERMSEQSDPRRPQFALVGVESPAFGWCASRFKRVDGPHPVSEVEQLCASCEQPAGYCAENCAVRPRECSECHALAALFQADGLCAYCVRRLNDSDEEQRESMDGPRAKPKVRAHTEAALRREAERPRGNPAERKSLAAGHPASWPSVGDDEP